MRDPHNLPPSQEIEQVAINTLLLDEVAYRFEKALDEEQLYQPGYTFVTIDYEPDGQPVAAFNLAEDYEHYYSNEGIVLAIRLPIKSAAEEVSGIELLDQAINSDRFFIVKQYQSGQNKTYKITDATIKPYRSPLMHHVFPYKVPRSYPSKLLKQLKDFKLVAARPNEAIAGENT